MGVAAASRADVDIGFAQEQGHGEGNSTRKEREF